MIKLFNHEEESMDRYFSRITYSQVTKKGNECTAPDFYILDDCPIPIGDLEELPSFKINGIEKQVIGYKIGRFLGNLNALENNPGRLHQPMQQVSYNSRSDGAFGTYENEPGKTISYYDKGPLVGLLLDFEIRNAKLPGLKILLLCRQLF